MSDPRSGPYRMPWRWLLVLAAVILLVGVLPALMLAQWGPYLLGRALSAYLQASVTVQGVTGGWWNGVTVRQLTVAEDPTPQAPTLVRVDGQLTLPFRGAVWHAMGWRLAVTSDRFVFDDTFTEVHTTVVKSGDQLQIADLHVRRGTGRVDGAGAWRLAEPVDGGLQVQMDHLPFGQSLAQGAAEGPYLVEGMLSGTVTWRMDHNGEHFTVDGHVHPLHLRHAAATLVQVPEGLVHGGLRRDRDGTWWGDRLVFRSDGVAAEQLDLRLEAGKRVPLLALVVPLFLLEPDRQDPIRMSGMFDAELHASGTYDGQPGWGQSVNGDGYFRITQGAVIGSTVISGFVMKALTLPGNLVDQSLKALLDRGGQPLQVVRSLLQRPFVFGTLNSPIELRAGNIHLTDNFTVTAPEFSLLINGHSTLEGEVDYEVHSDLIHRVLFGEVIDLADKVPMLGTVLHDINPFQLVHRHIELSATVQGNIFRRNATGQPDVHVDAYFVQ